jgi:transposase
MKALHGGKATPDTIDAHKIAVLLRGGMLPQAYGYPAKRRAPRDLLRRRMSCLRKRAELLTPVQQTNRQSNLPDIGKKMASKANRAGVAERLADLAVQKSIAGDLAVIDSYDRLLNDLDLQIVTTAKAHDANTFYRLQAVPGIGQILRLVLRYELHDIRRVPRGQEFVSSCRVVKCATASAGKRYGPAGTKMGHAYLTWAFSEAAVLFLRANPAAQNYVARLGNKQSTGNALTVLAHKLARVVYDMLKRDTAFDLQKVLNG